MYKMIEIKQTVRGPELGPDDLCKQCLDDVEDSRKEATMYEINRSEIVKTVMEADRELKSGFYVSRPWIM